MTARPRALAATARRIATLARWLGPWADEHGRPADVTRRSLRVAMPEAAGGGSAEAWLYAPMSVPIAGAYAVAPGLHWLGPRDPRMDRFCRVLAASGSLVLSPGIRDFMDLRVSARAPHEFQAAVSALRDAPEYPRGRKPWLFSISFGSLLALRAAAAPQLRAHIGGAVVYGGYADWRALMHFGLTGLLADGSRARYFDPLNRPVVFLTMLDAILPLAGVDRAHEPALTAAWQEFARRTWSRAGAARDEHYPRVARALAADLPAPARALYLMGCGVEKGGVALCERALEHCDGSHMDVRPHLAGLRCPVHLAHGADDDVIPVEHAHALAAALPAGHPHGLYITGLYGHTARGSLRRAIPALGREAATLARLVRAIASYSETS